MAVLIAGEKSQVICSAFRFKGIKAFSCDLQDCTGGRPDWHIKGNAFDIINDGWRLVIAHPVCTRLCNSGYWYIKRHGLYNEVKEAADTFNAFLYCNAGRVAVENPVMNPEAKKYIIRQTQSIQPYNFGDNASKRTRLWLRNLPPLVNTQYYPPRIVNNMKRWGNQTNGGWNKLPPSDNRAELRSITYAGIALAMADQWGKLL